MKLKDRVAIVTGSSRGIGRSIALALAKEGADLVINYAQRADKAKTVEEQIHSMGRRAISVKADVSDFDQVSHMVNSAIAEFGKVDILVNNAAQHRGRVVHKLSNDDWNVVINSNLTGTFYCCKQVVPHMINQKAGKIINISSAVGVRGFPGDVAYGAAKAGILGLTKSLAREVAHYGINVNAIVCGYVETDMTMMVQKAQRDFMASMIPISRIGQPDDIAEVVTFLAYGGTYMTGSLIHVDGGVGM
ncbi:MAG: 3-oxoacyl-ACP reductase FabG [Smithellaceae bacterium]|nr:3-oxoacyl-ACP reductase FabG [Smithellaceae bacterium]